ncbi:MAG: Nramp family divalent metal transporter [Gammaproteobacteria bacterium]|nr:Nramp family divalent metal transporter [Gammaproteobacteria bacterium]
MSNSTPSKPKNLVSRFFSALGPGVIAGAADDDPSGIATYSIAGAQLGTSLLWTAFLTWPLMAAVQMMCARIGMVTGRGLAGALRQKFPKPVMVIVCVLLVTANTINIGADLTAMADAAELLSGVDSHLLVVLFGVGITYATIRLRYYQIARILKWLALSLFSYIITAFVVGPDWGAVAKDAFIPSLPRGPAAWATLVAILGTTISPYLFFWQASQEVEEEKAMGRVLLVNRQGATPREILKRKLDVGVGTFFSNLVMFFIILTTALVLNTHGITQLDTSAQVAEALRPLAGSFAMTLYTAGILGVGFLAIPILAGSAAYAFAETFNWTEGLDNKLGQAWSFYSIIILSILVGIAIDWIGINPIKALFWTAVINGLLAPFLLIGILAVASDAAIMNNQPSSRLGRSVVLATTLLMFGAAIGMFAFAE